MEKITLEGGNDFVLDISLSDILSFIQNPQKVYWSILRIEGVGFFDGTTMLDIENEVNNSRNGFSVSIEKLLYLDKSSSQLIELLLVGDRNSSNLNRFEDEKLMHCTCEYCFQLVDSSYWEITSLDYDFLAKIKKALK